MIVHDPTLLPHLAENKKSENELFRKFIKTLKSEFLDQQVSDIQTDIESKIDCTKCANCCKILEAGISLKEAEQLSEFKNISSIEFIKEYTETEKPSSVIYLKKKPCIFLEENKCTVYSSRPQSCSSYPHLAGPNFKYRLRSIFSNYSICPIVYNSIEKLKIQLEFQYPIAE